MKKLKEYDISFVGLKQGEHQFEYNINKDFLQLFSFDEVNDINQKVTILLSKKSTFMELHFKNEGTVVMYQASLSTLQYRANYYW